MKLLVILIVGGLFYVLQNLIFKKFWIKKLDVTVEYEENMVREGENNVLVEIIENDKLLPLPVLQIKFSATRTFIFPKEVNSAVTDNYYRNEFFSVKPYQKITRKYRFIASHRGEYKLNSLDIICKDFFLTRNMVAYTSADSYVTVLPKRISKGDVSDEILNLTGEVVKRSRLFEDPFEFRAIRDYIPGDSMNHINWKATAQYDELMVNTFNTTDNQKVVLLVNLDMNAVIKRDTLCEETIRIADYLADTFIGNRLSVAMYTNGSDYETKEIVNVDEGCDATHLLNLEINLARIDLNERIFPFKDVCRKHIKENDMSTEYIIISNYRKDDFVKMYEAYKEDGYNLSLIVPEFAYNSIEPFGMGRELKWVVYDER